LACSAYKQLRVSGSVGYDTATWERSLRILRPRAVRLDDLITHRLPLSRWREAFDLCQTKQAIQVLLSPMADIGSGGASTV
jgi:L-iditol 2-dehydrogenase